jgi:hypothetical protein
MFLRLLEIAASWRQSLLPVFVKARDVLKRIREEEMSPECFMRGTLFRINENPISARGIVGISPIPHSDTHVVESCWGSRNSFYFRIQRLGIEDYIPLIIAHSLRPHNPVRTFFSNPTRFLSNTDVFTKSQRLESSFLSAGIQHTGEVFFQSREFRRRLLDNGLGLVLRRSLWVRPCQR